MNRSDPERLRLYKVWTAMRQRCNNPKSVGYDNYGGRGITVCERWDDFDAFCADMGPRPPGMSLDRVNNDGRYSPENCRWATRTEQNRNKRTNVHILHRGERITAIELSERLGIPDATLLERVRRGHPAEMLGQRLPRTGGTYRGEKNGRARLSEADVVQMRAENAAGLATQAELACRFGVSIKTVSSIITRRNWKHVA